jgi:transcriptional regulator with XRE-family HTH domain
VPNLTPAQVGLPPGGTRRVPGLRREEVASLAGLSVDYYTRLEQGREQHPSPSVLNGLARVLRLGPDAQRYLFAIATSGPRVPASRGRAPISANLLALVEEWTNHPAVVG